MDFKLVKEEPIGVENPNLFITVKNGDNLLSSGDVIDISSSDDDDSSSSKKKQKVEKRSEGTAGGVVLPVGFLDPLTPLGPVEEVNVPSTATVSQQQKRPTVNAAAEKGNVNAASVNYKQFWKAGDYEGAPSGDWENISVGMDHVRVHPRFLHSNATSHKWALGAFAELLDNALDEICTGATYCNIDMLQSKKDGNKMLLIEDNGGGMDPDKMRQCMSLGYSVKSKIANTIGQYGNGFKTSTMRLGADVIVFSRSCGKDGKRPTQSIGLLSYTFLRSTGKEDIIVPMLDYERGGGDWSKMIRSNLGDWNRNVETIVQWSPFSDEADLLRQFNLMKDHGTRIIIYNLWEDDQGMLELDFETDKHDILLRGVNRDEKNIQMAKEYPNSRHFLTYRHSLRSYASILYLRLAAGFRVILRGQDVEHHNIVNDMMLTQEVTYRPQPGPEGVPKDSNMLAVVTMGFVKDAKHHIDVQGFNVYHKNRLIKPFWRLWNAAGSDGRGVIGVLEANFVEPAHDKQGFERTTVLSRLETKLIQMQKTYWSTYCHKIGYAPRRNKYAPDSFRESTPDYTPQTSPRHKSKGISSSSQTLDSDKFYRNTYQEHEKVSFGKTGRTLDGKHRSGNIPSKNKSGFKTPSKFGNVTSLSESSSDDEYQASRREKKRMNGSNQKEVPVKNFYAKNDTNTMQPSQGYESYSYSIEQLREENRELKERLNKKEQNVSTDIILELEMEKEKCKSLETQLNEAKEKMEDMTREQSSLLHIYSLERSQHDNEEESLRKKLKEANNTIQELRERNWRR